MPARVAGVLLAAGDGSRLGQPKALVRLAGQTLAARGADLLRAGGADLVIVVTGAVAVDLPAVQVVQNPRWRDGMGSSFAAGLAAIPGDCAAAVVALADQPLVGAESVRRLIAAFAEGAGVAVAAYHGQPRNPVLLTRPHWAEATELAVGDVGARPFLRAHPELITLVECGDTGRPDDIDTPDDLDRIGRALDQAAARADRPAGPTDAPRAGRAR